MARKANLTFDQGADLSITIDVTYANGSIFDLTDFTAGFNMKKHWKSANSYSVTAAVTSEAGGEITLTANNTVMSAIPPGRYDYVLQVTSNTNIVSRVVEGQVEVLPLIE